ncbi:30S ribosomal S17P protein [Fusarium beomiforme]|uniref:30S ribosomal S17P protein n=1 Tax=Fusarium beomiforme TaxID=44412 RepID=A0A9P5DUR6_9HYPO|nr:30S ribosomal S17P protein [Fusarium beomiforme]
MECLNLGPESIASIRSMNEADLRSFAAKKDPPDSGKDLKLRIYAGYLVFEASNSEQALGKAILEIGKWIVALPLNEPALDEWFDILAALLVILHHHQQLAGNDEAGLRHAVSRDSMLSNSNLRMSLLKNQAARSMASFEQSQQSEDLSLAIAIVEYLLPRVDLNKSVRLQNNLGVMLHKRYQKARAMKDLDRAIEAMKASISVTPHDSPDLADRLNNLSIWLSARCEMTDRIDDLNSAVEAAKRAVETSPEDNRHYPGYLSNLANRHGQRFQKTGIVKDIDCAITASSRALKLTPPGHPGLPGFTNSLSTWLSARFEKLGELSDLNRAIDEARCAVDAVHQDNPERATFLSTLGSNLSKRYERKDSVKDLDEALLILTQAVDATPRNAPQFASFSNNLGICYGMRFERTGSTKDLDHAIKRIHEAVSGTPQGHPQLANRLHSLGNHLSTRFKRTGAMKDLELAIEAAEKAVNDATKTHPHYPEYLNSLANKLSLRFERTIEMQDLDRAVELLDEAAKASPPNHDSLARHMNNLGSSLRTRYERIGRENDIIRAIEAIQKAVDLTPQGHPDLPSYLNNLGNAFGCRFNRTASSDDLDSAIKMITLGVNAMSVDHPDRAYLINNLGNWLDKRSVTIGASNDRDSQIYWYLQAWNSKTAPPSQRIRAAGSAGHIYVLRKEWEKASSLLREAVLLLPKVTPRFLAHTDRQSLLSQLSGLTSMAAAASLSAGNEPLEALKLLELGRGLISGLVMDIRTDISDLTIEHPDLANEFDHLRDTISNFQSVAGGSTTENDFGSWQRQQERLQTADEEFGILLRKIREKPGFESFLLPPPEADLMAAATPDPIIFVNVSFYRSDAFIIESTGIRTIELPDLSQSKIREWAAFPLAKSELAPRLKWLWDALCSPCLDILDLKSPVLNDDWPHVWWIPTDALTSIPIHAAGYYFEGSKETVLDRTMSSYALTIKSLLHGRKRNSISAREPSRNSALLVAMPETPGSKRLPYAVDEVKMLEQMCPVLNLNPETPNTVKKDVLVSLEGCKVFHFAGHGRLDPGKPSQSSLCLLDWKTNPLTVQNIRDSNLERNRPFLAYLSACSTGANRDSRLSDEGIHLVAAFHLTGFRHVIGTLWEVSDKHCVDVAEAFYQTLRDEGMDDLAVCKGLHRALRKLRDEGRLESKDARDIVALGSEDDQRDMGNTHWMPYVHFGC